MGWPDVYGVDPAWNVGCWKLMRGLVAWAIGSYDPLQVVSRHMRRLAMTFAILAFSAGALASPKLFPPPNGGHLVLVGSMQHLVRSDDPLSIERGEIIQVGNGCGYDTAVVEVSEQLIGHYKLNVLAAHLQIGEFCDSLLQPEVERYLLTLNWNGIVWEVDQELSSRLLPDENGEMWVVEPDLISKVEQAGGPRSKSVRFNRSMLEEIALGQVVRRGAEFEPGSTRADQIKEVEQLLPVKGAWPDNPLYFARGISLSALAEWLSAN